VKFLGCAKMKAELDWFVNF